MPEFFRELRRRNVFRVAGLYAVIGWLIAQIGSVLESSLGLPDWFDAVVVTLLLLGLPLALIFAWAFEMTPDGVKPTRTVPAEQSITATTGRRLDVIILGALVLVAGLVSWQIVATPGEVTQRAASTTVSEASIAVLPFADMSAEGNQEYFSDGIAEELLNVLAQVPDLQVAGRTSSFAFKNRNEDLREIGEILEVAHILEGSVRKSGDRVRITAQLIEVNSGYHMWSETYDRDLNDIFAVQDEISAAITAELVPRLTGAPQVQVARSSDIDAYDLYLLAQQQAKGASEVQFADAASTLDEALAIDPDFVPALAWRGYYELMGSDATGATGRIPFDEAKETARHFIDRAIELDPKSPDALFAKAGLYLFEGNFPESERHYRLALVQRPNFPYARNDLGFAFMQQGKREEALEQFEISLEHDPALADANTNLMFLYLSQGEYEKARAGLDRWERISPDSPALLFAQLIYYGETGAYGDLILTYQADRNTGENNPRIVRYIPFIWATLGEYDKALDLAGPGLKSAILLAKQQPKEAERAAIAYREENPGEEYEYLFLLHMTRQWDKLVTYYETTFESAEAFTLSDPHPPFRVIVPALVFRDHPDADQLLDDWEKHMDAHIADTPVNKDNEHELAKIAVLRGASGDEVMAHLDRAFELGLRSGGVGLEPIWRRIEDQARFNEFVDRTEAAINEERAKLDLPPKSLPKEIGG